MKFCPFFSGKIFGACQLIDNDRMLMQFCVLMHAYVVANEQLGCCNTGSG